MCTCWSVICRDPVSACMTIYMEINASYSRGDWRRVTWFWHGEMRCCCKIEWHGVLLQCSWLMWNFLINFCDLVYHYIIDILLEWLYKINLLVSLKARKYFHLKIDLLEKFITNKITKILRNIIKFKSNQIGTKKTIYIRVENRIVWTKIGILFAYF